MFMKKSIYWIILSLGILGISLSCGDDSDDSSSSAATATTTTISMDDCFSYDYIHPNQACQKLMANLIIDGINTKHSTSIEKISYTKDAEIKQQDKVTSLGINKMVVLGDSLAAGLKQVSLTPDIKYNYTTDSFAIMVAKSLGLTAGTTNDSDFIYPETDNKTDSLASEVAAGAQDSSNAVTRGTIKNASSVTGSFHLQAYPGIQLGLLTYSKTQIKTLSDQYAAAGSTTLQGRLPLWNQVLKVDDKSPTAQAAALVPDLVIINAGNNDILAPAVYENVPLTTESDFTNIYTGMLAAFKAANANVKFVVFKVADVGGAPHFDLKQTYNYMDQVLGTSKGTLATLFSGSVTLYGKTDDSVIASGTQTTRVIDLTKDKIKLAALTNILAGKGTSESNPLDDTDWLSETELASINDYFTKYNTIIANLADTNGAILIDTSSDLKKLVEDGSVTK